MATLKMMMAFLCLLLTIVSSNRVTENPKPTAWPEQFHSVLVMNNTKTKELQVVDLWYDWPNGRNLNLIQHQLGKLLYDVEWNNGSSYYYTRGGGGGDSECRTVLFEVGILRPNWLEGATYLGQQHIDGFLCNVWQKVDFIWYYEDVLTHRPVQWLFYTGRAFHVMTFEVGAVLEDSEWQAPAYCFNKEEEHQTLQHPLHFMRDSVPLALI
ncbi:hypothetical protein SOVF_021510 [Spinacia oleracea]|uniref:Uncharacterized protein At4g14100 n=1 Tax=Spinacia oleracea TaxID=3562 RepID=A0A9R0IBH0_SPIOL|nr:uncharacterized protein At4g14100 [Spinacia oleracea]KNA23725.1 hypothetical protein SOVF_021510 [Spinacia oleracea]